MITDSVKLIFSGAISTKLWLAAILANVGAMTLSVFIDDELFPDLGVGATALLTIILIVGVIALFVTLWNLTRALALAHTGEQGGVGPWIGWGFVAILPVVPLFILLDFASDEQPFWLLSSFVLAAASCLLVPISVHATGRAINRNGASLGTIFDYWLARYTRLFVAYFIVSVPLTMISDALDNYGNSTPTDAILTAFATSILYFIVTLLSIAVTVIAYREAEAGRPLSAS